MKRFTMIMAMVVMMVMPVFAERVTPETARKVATTFLSSKGVKAELHLIDYADREAFPNFYVFGTENSFVIISADDCVQPVLGYSTENPFGTKKMPENLFWWLKDYDEQIADAAKSGQKAISEVVQQWKELASGNASKAKSEVIVEPLIQTKWDQGSPYNKLCPGGNATGCVATAMAQIMKYWSTVYENEMYENPTGFWNYLTKGFGSHSYTPTLHADYGEQSADFGNTTYDWANMIDSYSGTYSEAQENAIAKLMYHCGVSVNMDYGLNGTSSSAPTSDVVDALKTYFNYSQTVRYVTRASIVDEAGQEDLEQWEDMLKAELNAIPPRPIQYRGKKSGGHSFICDGYETDANNNDKFHFNWGWGGNGDGSYVIVTSIQYSSDQAAIFGIQPISYDAKPSGLVTSVSNRNVNLTWDEVGSASSYNVYRNYILIGNTDVNTNSFTDVNVPIGDYVYSVRSVDSQGNISLPSDMANVNVRFECTLENLTNEHLEMSYQGGNATLQWKAPYSLQYLDYYSFEGDYGPLHVGEITFYWGACFPTSLLVSGSSLTSVSTYFHTSGTYTAYVYQCSSKTTPSGNPIIINGTYSKGWNTIPIETIAQNNEPYIWVVFESSGIDVPTIVGIQNVVQNANEGNYYSVDGSVWNHFNGYAFFISASFTDGNFTYIIYDNDESVAEGLNVPIHTLSDISPGTAHQYTVKAESDEAESAASNMVGITLGTASINDLTLNVNDMMTIAPNSTLTVNGTLTNTNPDNFILEDGAQLVTSSENVQATVMKSIEPASNWGEGNYTADGWYFIASPIVSTIDYEIAGMITKDETADETVIHTFDLYRYNESADREWENFWGHNTNISPFTIDNGMGYLYASKNGTTIRFKGIINPYSATNNIVTLSQDGWNLIGNPFTCAVTVSEPFSELNNGSSVTNKAAGDTINPCAGIAVYGNANDVVTFTKLATQNAMQSPGNLRITLEQQAITRDGFDVTTIDNAIVSFSESASLPKFTLLGTNSKLYIPQGDEEYAIVSAEALGEMPLNFHANENGQYTLTVNPENVEMDYLHLIDNLTGNDVDLLSTPSYSFEAKTNDYESRFRLVFFAREDADGDSETFAFVNNGQIIITGMGDACNASLQIVDLTGRIVFCGDAARGISTTEMPAGIYVLRLITAGGVKTQKIIID